jgi:putative peptidoglycan lipid II flippase
VTAESHPALDEAVGCAAGVGERGDGGRHSVGRLSLLSFASVVSDRLSAFLLVAVIAAVFGAGHQSDLYFLALVIPTAVGGALSDAFYTVHLPVFSRAGAESLRLGTAIRRATLLAGTLTLAYVAALVAVSPKGLYVWLIPSSVLLTMSLSGVYAAYFVAHRRYALAVFRVPLATSSALALVFVFIPFWRSAGALAGSIAAANLAVLVLLFFRGPRHRTADRTDTGSVQSYRRLLGSTASAFVAVAIGGPLVIVVERALASTLATGAVSLLTFSRNVATIPVLVPSALASGVFPAAAAYHADAQRRSLARLMLASVRVGALFGLASVAFLIIGRVELVRVALERGALHQAQARTITHLVLILSWSLIGASVLVVVSRGLFAMERYRLVAALSAGSLILYVGMAAILRWQLGIDGLAAAFTIALVATGLASCVVLFKVLELSLREVLLNWVALPLLLATAFTAGAYAGHLVVADSSPSVGQAIMTLVVSLLAGVVTLAATVSLLRTREYVAIQNALSRRAIATPRAEGPTHHQPFDR